MHVKVVGGFLVSELLGLFVSMSTCGIPQPRSFCTEWSMAYVGEAPQRWQTTAAGGA